MECTERKIPFYLSIWFIVIVYMLTYCLFGIPGVILAIVRVVKYKEKRTGGIIVLAITLTFSVTLLLACIFVVWEENRIPNLIEKGKYEEAQELLEEKIKTQGYWSDYENYALLYSKQGDYDKAVDVLFQYYDNHELADISESNVKVLDEYYDSVNKNTQERIDEFRSDYQVAMERKKLEPNGHEWQEATCLEPRKCSICGATEGEIGEHSWQEATYEHPKTCSTCGMTEGKPLVLEENSDVEVTNEIEAKNMKDNIGKSSVEIEEAPLVEVEEQEDELEGDVGLEDELEDEELGDEEEWEDEEIQDYEEWGNEEWEDGVQQYEYEVDNQLLESENLETHKYENSSKGKKIVKLIKNSKDADQKEFIYLTEKAKIFSDQKTYEVTIKSNNDFLYFGKVKNNRPNGYGILYFKGRPVYLGEFKKGVKSGYGLEFDSDGGDNWNQIAYEGEFKDGLREGKGIIYQRAIDADMYCYNSSRYTKTAKGFQQIYFNMDLIKTAIHYEGKFKKGELSGKGKEYYFDGTLCYEGKYKKGSRHGKGTLYYLDGKVEYKGSFAYGKYNGKGTLYYPDGKVEYKGAFKNGDVKK